MTDTRHETRFSFPGFLRDNVHALDNVVILGAKDRPSWACMLEVDSHEPRQFGDSDIAMAEPR